MRGACLQERTAHVSPCPVTGHWHAHFLSLPARHEWGESRREGPAIKAFLLSPALYSLLRREEREQRPDVSRVTGRNARTKSGEFSPGGEGGPIHTTSALARCRSQAIDTSSIHPIPSARVP